MLFESSFDCLTTSTLLISLCNFASLGDIAGTLTNKIITISSINESWIRSALRWRSKIANQDLSESVFISWLSCNLVSLLSAISSLTLIRLILIQKAWSICSSIKDIGLRVLTGEDSGGVGVVGVVVGEWHNLGHFNCWFSGFKRLEINCNLSVLKLLGSWKLKVEVCKTWRLFLKAVFEKGFFIRLLKKLMPFIFENKSSN